MTLSLISWPIHVLFKTLSYYAMEVYILHLHIVLFMYYIMHVSRDSCRYNR